MTGAGAEFENGFGDPPGENTVVTDPDKHHCEHALKSLDHLVVIDLFLTETAQLADVVLPATGFAETDGVQTNTERRVQRLRAAVPSVGESKPDWWIIAEIAKRMGTPGFDKFESAKDVFNVIFFIVITSVLVQGLTLVPSARWLGVTETPSDPTD